MSKLQNNFTTPEQSKRLLELGVPAWTADCYHIRPFGNQIYDKTPNINYNLQNYKETTQRFRQTPNGTGKYSTTTPCWSVGRLMEVFAICFDPDFIHFDTYADGISFLKQMMGKFETYAENMDFSKLEEGV